MKRLILTSLCMVFVVGTALADWNPGDPNKWVQMPDLSTEGVDVFSSTHQPSSAGGLADDFLCTTTGYVTDIHIWGSWLGGWLPPEGAASVPFRLSIYSDIPASGETHSRPGDVLWQHDFSPEDFTVRKYADAIEDWYTPMLDESQYTEYYSNDHNEAWQYNFVAEADEELENLFYQQGTPQDPVVYWLGVKAILPPGSDAIFGWKTSTDHWNDDAVFWDPTSGWQELKYPMHDLVGNPLTYGGQSMDMAFVITPEPATIAMFGLGGLLLGRNRKFNKKQK